MTLTIELTTEEEARLRQAAQRAGLDETEYLRGLIEALPLEAMPTNGAELVDYWTRHGLIGYRSDITDSQLYARNLRETAQERR